VTGFNLDLCDEMHRARPIRSDILSCGWRDSLIGDESSKEDEIMTSDDWKSKVAPRGSFGVAQGDTSQSFSATKKAAKSKTTEGSEAGTRYQPKPLDRPSPSEEPLLGRFGKRE
jgi:hypothetical protein